MERLKKILKRVFSVWCVTHSIMLFIFLSGCWSDSSPKLDITDAVYKNGNIEIFAKNSGGSKISGVYHFAALINADVPFQVDVKKEKIPEKGQTGMIACIPESVLKNVSGKEYNLESSLGWYKEKEGKLALSTKKNDEIVFKKTLVRSEI